MQATDKYIVITTINQNTAAIQAFENFPDWRVILVGDKKTPESQSPGFLSCDRQRNLNLSLDSYVPYNHYARKNIGYLYALKSGASIIYDTDDDNIPYDDWRILDFNSNVCLYSENKYLNIYKYFSVRNIWPRGLPLDEISAVGDCVDGTQARIGVWQGIADKDPDVDAIYRLTDNSPCIFDKKPPVHINASSYCPFNSQNTTWTTAVFPLMYLPSTVSFRFTDILRGYVAQRVMREHDFALGFHGATVYQERNEHDLMSDFMSEVICYTRIKELVGILDSLPLGKTMHNDLIDVYRALYANEFVEHAELEILNAWLSDIKGITHG